MPLTGDEGHVWIRHYDTMPPAVRKRLRSSAFNICPACLESYILPELKAKHPRLSYEKTLFKAIECVEAEFKREHPVPVRPR